MEGNFHLQDIVKIFMKRIKLLIFIPLLFAAAGFAISTWVIDPIYEAEVDLLINNPTTQNGETISAVDIETNLRLIETYRFIVKSDRITTLVSEKLNLGYSNKALKKKLRIEIHEDSQIIQLFFTDSDLDVAVETVNLYAKLFQSEIKSLMDMENIIILTNADKEKHRQPILPQPIITTIILYSIGVLITCLYISISTYLFLKVDSKDDMERFLPYPVMGVVGQIKYSKKQKEFNILSILKEHKENKLTAPIIEAYRTIRTNLDFKMKTKEHSTLLLTSTSKGEGKTITASNVATMMALNNDRTVLIDADLRKEKPSLQSAHFGLAHYLSGHCTINKIIQLTPVKNLHYIEGGIMPPTPSELLASKKMDELLTELQKSYDRIVIDAPPLLFTDPVILSTKVDGCLIVTQVNKTKFSHLQQAIKKLTNVNANILGMILNKKKMKKSEIKFYNYYGTR